MKQLPTLGPAEADDESIPTNWQGRARLPRVTRVFLGSYPTPVFSVPQLSSSDAELWIKDDSVTHPRYGGNKVRKLEGIFEVARKRHARRILTAGAAGSHHVLATTVLGKQLGFEVAAVLCPQPHSEHAEDTLRASLSQGLEAVPVSSMARVPLGILRARRKGDIVVPVGGSNVEGTLGYVGAVEELLGQIRTGELPEPDIIVAALGSGGTVGGLVAGVAREGLASKVLGVQVATPSQAGYPLALSLAWLATRRLAGEASVGALRRILRVDTSELGDGYGWPTSGGLRAMTSASRAGVCLEPTYTAKAFAKALKLVGHLPEGDGRPGSRETQGLARRPLRVLYWHTLSAVPSHSLMTPSQILPPELRRLFMSAPSPSSYDLPPSDAQAQ